MIVPTVRDSFGRKDADALVELLAGDDPELGRAAQERVQEEGIDVLLDDPRVLNALLTGDPVGVRPPVVFYILIRQALLEGGVRDPATADYVTSLMLAFGSGKRAYRVSPGAHEEFHYLVDLVRRMGEVEEREAFLVRSHLGNYALWLAGFFPDFLSARVRRRGAPSIRYYEEMGATGYRLAARSPQAEHLGLEELLLQVAEEFTEVRWALNRVSDRHLWRSQANPVGRLIREVADPDQPPAPDR